jgi:Ca2+-binding EF-hand superfamily protein
MKLTTTRITCVTALLSVFGSAFVLSTVFAQDAVDRPDRAAFHDEGFGGPGHTRAARRASPAHMIERLDSNGDGQVDTEEFIAPQVARIDEMFEQRDTDDDGLISESEYQSGKRVDTTRRGRRAERLQSLDLNSADLVACVRRTIADFEPPQRLDPEHQQDRFDTLDTNNDGSLGLTEVTSAMEGHAMTRFSRLDTSGDNFITQDEADAQQQASRHVRNVVRACIKELAAG